MNRETFARAADSITIKSPGCSPERNIHFFFGVTDSGDSRTGCCIWLSKVIDIEYGCRAEDIAGRVMRMRGGFGDKPVQDWLITKNEVTSIL